MFTVIDAALIRLATHPAAELVPGSVTGRPVRPNFTADPADAVPAWRAWLTTVWAQPGFAAAVTDASPSLARRVETILSGREQRPKPVRSAVVSVLRYQLRAASRATPFGRFAGIAPAALGPSTLVRIGDQHHETVRADATWLAGIITQLEQHSALLQRLQVVLNNTAVRRGDRLVVGLRQHPAPAADRTDPAEVSIRWTRPIEQITRAARTPISWNDLVDQLAASFPHSARPVIVTMLTRLVEQRVLLTSLRPAMTVPDPVAAVLRVIDAAAVADDPAIAALADQLRDRAPLVCGPGRIDLRVDAQVVVPPPVAAAAEQAAAVLARLSPHPFGRPHWRDFHTRFLERYGLGAAVPLLELVDPDTGLGYPAGYRGSPYEIPRPTVTSRDEVLLRLAQTAALHRRLAVELDDALLADLDTTGPDDGSSGGTAGAGGTGGGRAQWPVHAELAVRVDAASAASLDRGDFTLVVSGVFRAAGATAGRFLDLLPAADRDRMTRAYTAVVPLTDGALRVQVSCPPLYTETETVARSPRILPHQLSIGEHPAPGGADLEADDLVVVGDARRLFLWSRSMARPVEPELFSAVEFTNFAHPLMRFVCELTTARAAGFGPFAWGAAGQLPFLPRLTRGRVVISPARWHLTATDLPGPGSDRLAWSAALQRWRDQLMVPDSVYLGTNDQRIQLDLTQLAHQELLRSDLARRGHATVQEAPAPAALGWTGGRAHELIVPVASRQRTWPAITPPTGTENHPSTPLRPAGPRGHLPGAGAWLFAKLYGHPDRHTVLLTEQLPLLLDALRGTFGREPGWWFLPYRDPDHHLRLRIRLPTPDAFGPATQQLGTWTTQLRDAGLLTTVQLDTYQPETGRFGHGPLLTAVEAVFAADSAAATAQRAATAAAAGAVAAEALTAAGLADLAAAFTGDLASGAHWLTTHLTQDPLPAPDRAVYDQALHLTRSADAVTALPGGVAVASTWTGRRAAVTAYRRCLDHAGAPPPDQVLASLLHLHSVRVHGLEPASEQLAHRLARSAALSHLARTPHRTTQ